MQCYFYGALYYHVEHCSLVLIFLFSIQESTLVELHRALGSSYETVAACQLKLRELLERSHGRLHGTAKLIGKSCSVHTTLFKAVFWSNI